MRTDDAKKHAALMGGVDGLFMLGVLGGYWIFALFSQAGRYPASSWLNTYRVFAAPLLGFAALVFWRNPIREQLASAWSEGRGSRRAAATGATGRQSQSRILSYASQDVLYVLLEQFGQCMAADLPTPKSCLPANLHQHRTGERIPASALRWVG